MSRYIDADALEREYQERYKLFTWDDGEREKATLARVIQVLHAQPTADVRPNEHGEWIDFSMSIKGVPTEACGNCGEWSLGMGKNFCPNCGADMRGEQNADG